MLWNVQTIWSASYGNWWKGSVTMTVIPNGVAKLRDGSPGAGIDATGTTKPFTVSRSGPTVVDGWAEDLLGNWRKASMTVQVDAVPPLAWWNTPCGQALRKGQAATANWGTSDTNVGIPRSVLGRHRVRHVDGGHEDAVEDGDRPGRQLDHDHLRLHGQVAHTFTGSNEGAARTSGCFPADMRYSLARSGVLDLVRVMTGGPHHGAAGKDRMNSRKLLLGSAVAVLAAAVAAGAMAGNGKHSSVTTVKAINKAPVIVVNRYVQDNLRWDHDVYKVASGGTIHVVNMAADEGPHTFTIVAKKDAPKNGLQAFNCRICNTLAKAHGANPNSDQPPKYPFLENGVGQATPPSIDRPGDSGVTGKGKKGESIDLPVSAPAGTKLWMMCLIHPWMQAEIDVT